MGPIQLSDIDGEVEDLLMGKRLSRGRLLSEPTEGVEQNIGFLGPAPRLGSDDSLRDTSRRGLAVKLAAPAAFSDFSTLESKSGGGSLLLFLLLLED